MPSFCVKSSYWVNICLNLKQKKKKKKKKKKNNKQKKKQLLN